MAQKKRGLGRSLDALIPTQVVEAEFDPTAHTDKSLSRTRSVPVHNVRPNPDQPRREFNEQALENLVTSINNYGILQPIIVTEVPDNGYQIIAGERRWRAAQMAGLEAVPVLIRSLDDQDKLEVALIENLQREDLNLIETATAFFKLVDQFNITVHQIGERLGRDHSTIHNIIKLLELPEAAKRAVVEGKIVEGHARQILSLRNSPEKQQELLDLILKHGWSVRKAEQFVTAYKQGASDVKTAIQRVQNETPQTKKVSKRLGTKVWVHNMAKGGRLIIEFKNDDDLERITTNLLDS